MTGQIRNADLASPTCHTVKKFYQVTLTQGLKDIFGGFEIIKSARLFLKHTEFVMMSMLQSCH